MTQNKGTILVIDDDTALQTVLETALHSEGYHVVSASDGAEGLNLIAQIQPVLVITDIMMPNMDGVELFHAIQERLQANNIPVIMMTALSRKPWFADLEAEGAVFLQKPFVFDKLLDLVKISLL